MATLWFMLVSLMLAAYVILDGFDLGTGIIHWGVGRSEDERALNLRAIGPVWDGNEVWLLAAGGTLYFAFPPLYATSFSGFYLPLMMVLWLLMLRGVSVELRGHIKDSMWKTFFDACFTGASGLLAIFYGAALGNVIRGVPINEEGYFFEPLWTNFRVGPQPGILDWYTVLTGVVAFFSLAMHGATYLTVKTEDDMNARAQRIAMWGWWGSLATIMFALPATINVRPESMQNYRAYPWGFIFPVLTIGGLLAVASLLKRGKEKAAFVASSCYIGGALAGAAFAMYPTLLPASTDPARSLTIHNSAASAYGLHVGIIWWSIGFVLALGYFYHLYRMFQGKVSLQVEGYGD